MNLQQHTEHDGMTYCVGLAVQRVDFENDGTPPYRGIIERIERDELGEITYWVRWSGATAPDAHGPYAFKSLWYVETDMGDGLVVREDRGTPKTAWALYRWGWLVRRYKTERGLMRAVERLRNN